MLKVLVREGEGMLDIEVKLYKTAASAWSRLACIKKSDVQADMGIMAMRLKPTGRRSIVTPPLGMPLPGTEGSEQFRRFLGK